MMDFNPPAPAEFYQKLLHESREQARKLEAAVREAQDQTFQAKFLVLAINSPGLRNNVFCEDKRRSLEFLGVDVDAARRELQLQRNHL